MKFKDERIITETNLFRKLRAWWLVVFMFIVIALSLGNFAVLVVAGSGYLNFPDAVLGVLAGTNFVQFISCVVIGLKWLFPARQNNDKKNGNTR